MHARGGPSLKPTVDYQNHFAPRRTGLGTARVTQQFRTSLVRYFFKYSHPAQQTMLCFYLPSGSSTMKPLQLASLLICLSLCVLCAVFIRPSYSSGVVLKQSVKYDCTNSVDCLNVPTKDKEIDDESVPSDFLKNVVSEVASEDYMPAKATHLMEMANKLADVGVKEMNKAKYLRSVADLNDKKAQNLEKTLIELTASYNSKKSIAKWYQQQAVSAQSMSAQQQQKLLNQEHEDMTLSRQIRHQAELLDYVDKNQANDKFDGSGQASLDSPDALQKVFEQAGRK